VAGLTEDERSRLAALLRRWGQSLATGSSA